MVKRGPYWRRCLVQRGEDRKRRPIQVLRCQPVPEREARRGWSAVGDDR